MLRTALPGIVTGALLAVARIAGETAPLLFTALGSQYLSYRPEPADGGAAAQVFTYATGPTRSGTSYAWAAALVLILSSSCSASARGSRSRRRFGSMAEPPCADRAARDDRSARRAAVRIETDKLTAMYGKFTAVKGVVARLSRPIGSTR